ncbi:MAG: glycosyltransferase family 39 protein, partial [Syntrophales bacterium LBB04]|nr:glycosyltransferase family 39 protein [Syntrophales bacterium LBB04]
NLLLIVIGLVFCWQDITDAFKNLDAGESGSAGMASPGKASSLWKGRRYRKRLLLLALVAGSFLMVSQVVPQVHRIYYDEDIYANVGQTIALTGRSGMCNYGIFEYGEYYPHWLSYNKEPSGWPFLMSIAFQLFGVDEQYAFALNNVLYAASVLLVFWISTLFTGRYFPAWIAALVFACIPHALLWSNTMAAEPAAAFMGGLSVLCLLVYLRTQAWRHLYLLCAVLPLACQIRPGSAMVGLWAVVAAAVLRPRVFLRKEVWIAGLLTLLLLFPHILHLYATSGESWGAQGAKFSLDFLAKNFSINGLYYFNNEWFPVFFTFLALAALLPAPKRRASPGIGEASLPDDTVHPAVPLPHPPCRDADGKSRDAAHREEQGNGSGRAYPLLMLLWFLLFWGIFLFFYAGSYKYGADVRFALVSFMPLSVLSGLGADRICGWLIRLWETRANDETASLAQDGPVEAEGSTCIPRARAGLCPGGRTGRRSKRLIVQFLMITVLFFSWLPFMPFIRLIGQEAWGARHDHVYARSFLKAIPNRSIVITHIPTMFLLWNQSAIQSYAAINNPDDIAHLMEKYKGHVYFHRNYWCAADGAQKDLCRMIEEKYALEEVASAKGQNITYGLYKI